MHTSQVMVLEETPQCTFLIGRLWEGGAQERLSPERPSQIHRQGEHQQGDTPIQTTFPITHINQSLVINLTFNTLIAKQTGIRITF